MRRFLAVDRRVVPAGGIVLENETLCFYDMYYVQGDLMVITAVKGSYDIRCKLDEQGMNLKKMAYSK